MDEAAGNLAQIPASLWPIGIFTSQFWWAERDSAWHVNIDTQQRCPKAIYCYISMVEIHRIGDIIVQITNTDNLWQLKAP